jgi:cytochrome c oxidase subunit 2
MIQPENLILWLGIGCLAAICLLILALLAWRGLRSKVARDPATKDPPVQARRSLNWTIAPVLALALAVVPLTLRLYFQDTNPTPDLTVLVSGKMWFWTYKYPDHGNFSFEAPMLAAEGARPTSRGAYDHIVVPVGKTVRIIAVANDVIYSWAIPSIGARIEALPGQTEQSWFKAEDEGRYFGNCSELCGLPHAFRPIEVEVVSQERFDRWAAEARRNFAVLTTGSPRQAGER